MDDTTSGGMSNQTEPWHADDGGGDVVVAVDTSSKVGHLVAAVVAVAAAQSWNMTVG